MKRHLPCQRRLGRDTLSPCFYIVCLAMAELSLAAARVVPFKLIVDVRQCPTSLQGSTP